MVAFQICFRDYGTMLGMKIKKCLQTQSPEESKCLTNREWQRSPGSTTSATISLRNATVGFSRLNSTILTYHLADHWTTHDIGASDLLAAFDGFFKGSVDAELGDMLEELSTIFAGAQNIKYAPLLIASSLTVSDKLYGAVAAQNRNVNALQSLLAFALYYCSSPVFKGLLSLSSDLTSLNGDLSKVLLEGLKNSPVITYSLATTSYELMVGSITIWVYTILGGLLILLSFITLSVCTFTEGEFKRPVTTPFADIDHRLLDFEDLPDAGQMRLWTDQTRVRIGGQGTL